MVSLSALYCQVICSVLAAAIQPVEPHALTEVCRYTFDNQNDLDLDDQPDDWVRRKGLQFPHYIPAQIDHTVGVDDDSSLRIDANGAAAIYYSPLIPIDDLHTFFFSGSIRTEKLHHDAALISISLLDHRRQRVQRFLTRPVTGNHDSWVPVELGPIAPHKGVRFVVIGCHLTTGHNDVRDIGGHAWFDNLSIGRLPRMELESNFYRHFISGNSPVEVHCKVSGLDPGHQYALHFRFLDAEQNMRRETQLPLEEEMELADRQLAEFLEPQPVTWSFEPQPPGYYTTTATLLRDGAPIGSQSTTLVILKLIERTAETGEFGWSLQEPLQHRELSELPRIAQQAGINWLKYPVWQTVDDGNPLFASELASAFDDLNQLRVLPIGMLSEPPPKLRDQFARNWHGLNEVLSLPTEFWSSSLEPVVARYSSSVRHWQLGAENDRSFLGSSGLSSLLARARNCIQRICLHAEVGLPWTWDGEPPGHDVQFVSVSVEADTTPERLTELLRNTATPAGVRKGPQRWVLLKLAHLQGKELEDQAVGLARWMLAAKNAGADRIFLDDVYDDEHGLLNRDGSPRLLFIPWRTVAQELQGAKPLGRFAFPNQSPNAVFSRNGEVVVFIWNPEPTTESMYLGLNPQEMDIWGRVSAIPTDPVTGESQITVGPIPKMLIHCSEPIARWRLAAQYEIGRMQSIYGGHNDTLLVTNTFPQGVNGQLQLTLPPEWEAEPRSWTLAAEAGETLKLPTFLRLPPNANLGEQPTYWDFQITADRPYKFRVHRPYIVGLDDLKIEVLDRKLPDGRLEIEQIVSNHTNPLEKLDFRCSLFIPEARRQKLQITKLGQGSDRKFYYLPNADRYRGRELWLRLEQDGGRRVINYRWVVGKDW